MDLAQAGERAPPPLRTLFTLGRGQAKLLAAPNGAGWFIIHLDQIVPGNVANAPGLVEVVRTQLAQAIGNEYVEQFAKAAERGVKVSRSEGAIARLKKQLEGSDEAPE
jgi:peptidyl-prolyl cis-trans isomerase D